MADIHDLLSRQRTLADFGEFALRSDRLDDVLREACRLVAAAMGTRSATVLEIEKDGSLLVRARVGRAENLAGTTRPPSPGAPSEADAIARQRPVVVREPGVAERASAPILLPGGEAFGLLEIESSEPRNFQDDDHQFLKTYATILGPVIDRLRKISELRSAELRFRLIVEQTLDYSIFLTDAENRIVEWLPGAEAAFGWTAEEAKGREGSLIFTEEDIEAGADREEIDAARRHGSTPDQRWHKRKDGSLVFIDGFVTALKAGDEVQGFMKIGRDMSDRRQAEERQRVLLGELQHRTRNILAVVKSIAWRTAAASRSVDEFSARFKRRLDALARVNAMLSQLDQNARITFDELIRTEIQAHGAEDGPGQQVTLDGPTGIRLRSSNVQTLALGIHELATNAVKYGGLSDPAGRLHVAWRLIPREGGGECLHVVWEETAPTRIDPTAIGRGGYGRELIERALPYQLRAATHYDMRPEGVRCTLTLPISTQTNEPET